jgi:hypothetical protein
MNRKLNYIMPLLFCIMISCASISRPPLPPNLSIVPPTPDVKPEIAAFSGIWEGEWGASQKSILVIERIDNYSADVIVSIGSRGAGGFGFLQENSYDYFKAMVLLGPMLEWSALLESDPDAPGDYKCPCRMTIERDKNTDMLIVYWEYLKHNVKHRADMVRKK